MPVIPLPLSGAAPHAAGLSRPLRVARVAEISSPRHSAGRMVISGRMADVCAELDRMVRLEQLKDTCRKAA
jgi:hypothetical protein